MSVCTLPSTYNSQAMENPKALPAICTGMLCTSRDNGKVLSMNPTIAGVHAHRPSHVCACEKHARVEYRGLMPGQPNSCVAMSYD